MNFSERSFSTLVVSSSSKFNDFLRPILAERYCEPVTTVENVSAAKRAMNEREYDFLIINSPLTDDPGIKLSIDSSEGRGTVCLLLVRSEWYDELFAKVSEHGVFILPKPTSVSAVSEALSFLSSAFMRLKLISKKTNSLEEKMKEIRLVNHAKWVLIEQQKMTEEEAHKYIERRAMDNGLTKTEVANEILKVSSIQ